jgi:hypothetical protein
MPRKAVLIVALSLVFAAVTGTIALTKTVHLGQAAAKPPVSDRLIAKRSAMMDRFEASLRAQLRRKPPAVPRLPHLPAVSSTPAASAAPVPVAAAPQRVVYVRPAPIVVHKHRAGGAEHEGGTEGADHGEGGGSDD